MADLKSVEIGGRTFVACEPPKGGTSGPMPSTIHEDVFKALEQLDVDWVLAAEAKGKGTINNWNRAAKLRGVAVHYVQRLNADGQYDIYATRS